MKGNAEVINYCNYLLTTEHASAVQYGLHKAYASQAGLGGLASYIDERLQDELKHVRMLEEWIILNEGTPSTALAKVLTNPAFNQALSIDKAAELQARADYEKGIALAVAARDNATAQVLRTILSDEIDHIDDLESREQQIRLMTYQVWLSTQIK